VSRYSRAADLSPQRWERLITQSTSRVKAKPGFLVRFMSGLYDLRVRSCTAVITRSGKGIGRVVQNAKSRFRPRRGRCCRNGRRRLHCRQSCKNTIANESAPTNIVDRKLNMTLLLSFGSRRIAPQQGAEPALLEVILAARAFCRPGPRWKRQVTSRPLQRNHPVPR